MSNIKDLGILEAVTISWKLSFSKLGDFLKCLVPPLLLSIVGIAVSLIPAFALRDFGMENPGAYVFVVIVFAILGIAVFCKGFWDYLLASLAVFNMADSLAKNGQMQDGKTIVAQHRKRGGKYVLLLLALFFISIVAGSIPAIGIVASFVAGFFCFLATPAFALNTQISVSDSIKESFTLIYKNFLKTLGVLVLLNIIITMAYFLPLLIFGVLVFALLIMGGIKNAEGSAALICIVSLFATLYWVVFLPFMSMAYTLWYRKLKAQ